MVKFLIFRSNQYHVMKHIFLINIFAAVAIFGKAQELRSSLLQYQMNSLPLNPAYSSYEAATGFEGTYLGNFIGGGTASRIVQLNMQGATEGGGLGLTFQLYRDGSFGEVKLRPSWSRRLTLENGAEFSFGLVGGFNYFDVTNSFLSNNSDFISVDAGIGVYYHLDRFFAGISVINLFEKTSGLDQAATNNPARQNPYSLHVGGVFRLTDDIDLKPVGLVQYVNIYELPDQSFQNIRQAVSIDVQANVFIQKTYLFGVLYGFTNPDEGNGIIRYGFSATYILSKLRFSYSIQNNIETNNRSSLPITHIITAGYDIGGGEMGRTVRYF